MGTSLSEGAIPTSEPAKWIEKGRYFIGAATLFGALLYFVGRRFVESYFATIGIPPAFLEFSVADYIYQGAHPIRLLIAVAFTSIGIGLFRFITSDHNSKETQPAVNNEHLTTSDGLRRRVYKFLQSLQSFMEQFMFIYTIVFFIIVAFILPILASIEIFGDRFNLALNFSIIIYLAVTVYWGIAIMFDRKLVPRIKRHKKISKLFILGGLFVFFLLPYLGAGSYGVFMGIRDKSQQQLDSTFQTVTLTAQQPINETIVWSETDKGLYKTTDKLYLAYSSERFLFVISDRGVNEIIMISKDNLSSFTIDAYLLTPSPLSPSP